MRSGRRARASSALLSVGLAACALAVGATWLATRSDVRGIAVADAPPAARAAPVGGRERPRPLEHPDDPELGTRAEEPGVAIPERPALGRVEGLVTAAAGSALPARYECRATSADGAEVGLAVEGGRAEFTLELPPGEWRVHARTAALRTPTATVQVRAGGPPARFHGELRPAGGLWVCVAEQDGAPAAGLAVSLLGVEPAQPLVAAETGPDGCAHFEGVLEGDVEVALGDPELPLAGPHAYAYRATTRDPLRLQLPALVSLRVRVVDAFGQPVPGASVQASGRRAGRVRALTDGDGACALDRLPAGLVRVIALHEVLGQGDAAGDFAAGADGELTVRLRP